MNSTPAVSKQLRSFSRVRVVVSGTLSNASILTIGPLGRMAKSFELPATTFVRGEIAAILRWRMEDGDENYHHLLKRDVWEVVIPELVFEAVSEPQKKSTVFLMT